MKLEVIRFNKGKDSTNGILFDITNGKRKFLCYTLEDESRTKKVWGETCIPEGEYTLGLRTVGGLHAKYSKRFHVLTSIWGCFTYLMYLILNIFLFIGLGNTDEDTMRGCLLLGDFARKQQGNKGWLIKENGFIRADGSGASTTGL